MTAVNTKFKLDDRIPHWPSHIDACRPMLLRGTYGKDPEQIVSIRVGDETFVNFREGEITYANDEVYMKENYAFVRYLGEDETVTFSGAVHG